jgi:phosphoribosyl 1,2-cyclic phosphate phosphodiesterase
MKITILGSAAAEGYPGLFCDCENCRTAREKGGKDLRARAAVLVNDDLLIDFGPDLLAAALRYNIELTRLRLLLVTHFHGDHWYSENLMFRHQWFRATELSELHIIANTRLNSEIEALCNYHRIVKEDLVIKTTILEPFAALQADSYHIRALPAEHNPDTDPLIYTISQDGIRLIYASDTGLLAEPTWQALCGYKANLLIMEMTMGELSGEHHMGRQNFLTTVDRMRKEGTISDDCQTIANHFSHHCTPPHDELEKELAALGIIAAYDGLSIEV